MENLIRVMAAHWWVPLLRGIAAILFGLMALIWPGLTVYALLLVFGAYAIFDGVMAIVTAFRRKAADDRWWAWALDGVLSILIGLMALFWPEATALAFILWMAAWGVVAGVFRIIAAIRLRDEIEGEWALGLSGLLLVVWGVLMALVPAAGLLGIAWLIGLFALLIGVAMIVLAFRLRGLRTA
ncbi:HdeD family acid-resistance protein [Paracoccus sp. PS-1]|uniref:HdeD family acid-resistance protein n=1 Tax=unclassified Paracoccus (in: a-proteobacteria) TaxID=2688777 RepID=UPI00048FCE6B|nr:MULTISPECIES: HdeD family acid-resistance protein [unclassified Paracoccus (in: a-proteobacteria)]MDQ7262858.1 HdeD family acid-resistance protein [Paracoccus sp. PS1]